MSKAEKLAAFIEWMYPELAPSREYTEADRERVLTWIREEMAKPRFKVWEANEKAAEKAQEKE